MPPIESSGQKEQVNSKKIRLENEVLLSGTRTSTLQFERGYFKTRTSYRFFRKSAGTFFLGVVWTRELVRLKALCVSYIRHFFIDIALLEKNLQCNKIQVRPLFRQTVELKLMKI